MEIGHRWSTMDSLHHRHLVSVSSLWPPQHAQWSPLVQSLAPRTIINSAIFLWPRRRLCLFFLSVKMCLLSARMHLFVCYSNCILWENVAPFFYIRFLMFRPQIQGNTPWIDSKETPCVFFFVEHRYFLLPVAVQLSRHIAQANRYFPEPSHQSCEGNVLKPSTHLQKLAINHSTKFFSLWFFFASKRAPCLTVRRFNITWTKKPCSSWKFI